MDSLMRTPLECAAKWGRTEFARLMLDKGAKVDERNKYKGTCLHQAADGGHLALTKLLLERGAEIDPLTTYERTPLHFAAGKGHKNVCLALSLSLSLSLPYHLSTQCASPNVVLDSTWLQVAEILIETKANINAQDSKDRETPLHMAASNNHLEVAALLLESGASPNIRNKVSIDLSIYLKHMVAKTVDCVADCRLGSYAYDFLLSLSLSLSRYACV
jgi:ankyrin repeat protein